MKIWLNCVRKGAIISIFITLILTFEPNFFNGYLSLLSLNFQFDHHIVDFTQFCWLDRRQNNQTVLLMNE